MAHIEVEQVDQLLTKGQWIVHRHHGVGQVKGMEHKTIGGSENSYYRIDTHDSSFWVPTDNVKDEWFRPLSTAEEMEQALEVLQRPPKKMARNLNSRKGRIRKVKTEHDPVDVARIVRDLWGRRRRKKTLSQTETHALRHFMDCFLAELSICMNVSRDEARDQLTDILRDQSKSAATA